MMMEVGLIAPPAYSRQPQVVMNISNITQSITIFVDPFRTLT